MFSEFKKSIDKVVNERITSPLYGSFIFSWVAWNWKIIYVTIFISESTLKVNKIDFILENYSSTNNQIWYPIFSTIFLILVFPFLSIGAFWISLRYTNWRQSLKNSVEKKQLLTIEQSLELREIVRSQEERFERLLISKTEEINMLKQEIEAYRIQIRNKNDNDSEQQSESNIGAYEKEYQVLKNSEDLFREFKKIAPKAQKEFSMFSDGNNINLELFDYFLANDIIIKKSSGIYGLTVKGKYLNKLLLDEKYIKSK